MKSSYKEWDRLNNMCRIHERDEVGVVELTEGDWHYLEMQMMGHKICEVFGISQQELGLSPESDLDEMLHVPSLDEFMQEWAE